MNETFMKEKPVLPLILSMTLPMVLSMLVNSLYNIIDSFFVSQISEEAMTALSLVYPVQNFINASLLISLCRYVVVIIPVAFLLSRLFGAVGVWNAFWITEAITAIISLFIYRKAIAKPTMAVRKP